MSIPRPSNYDLNLRSQIIIDAMKADLKEEDMNLQDAANEFSTKYAHKAAEYKDAAAYAYMMEQIKKLEAKGEDITKYELVWVNSDPLSDGHLGYKIMTRLILHKIGEPLLPLS